MRISIGATSCVALLLALPSPLAALSYFVDATTPGFQSTGITLAMGDMVSIESTGTGHYTTCLPCSAVGPNGSPVVAGDPFLVAGVNQWSLVGSVGGSLIPSPSGAGFVGESLTFISPTDGELLLGFNDNGYGDNSGGFTSAITVVPEPSTVALLALGLVGIAVRGRREGGRNSP